jgi:hypothetical protein
MTGVISLRLDGEIVAESPLATSPPNTPIGTPAPSAQSRPPTPLPRMPKFLQEVGLVLVPYFPASGIRGRLRRLCEEAARYGIAGEDGLSPFGIEDVYYLRNGGIKGGGDENKVDILAAAVRRDRNPLIALFGANSPWDKGRLRVGRAAPATPVTVDVVRGVRADDFGRGGDALVVLSPEGRSEWLERSQRVAQASRMRQRLAEIDRARRREKDAGRLAALNAEAADIQAGLQGSESGTEVSVLLPLPGYEAIPAGTRLEHDFTLIDVRGYEVGLFLEALDRLALEPVIGAHVSQGCGIISGTWQVRMRRGALGRYENVGEIRLEPFKGLSVPEALAAMPREFQRRLEEGKFDFRAPVR